MFFGKRPPRTLVRRYVPELWRTATGSSQPRHSDDHAQRRPAAGIRGLCPESPTGRRQGSIERPGDADNPSDKDLGQPPVMIRSAVRYLRVYKAKKSSKWKVREPAFLD